MATRKIANQTEVNTEEKENKIVESEPIIPKDIDDTTYVTVRNGFRGILVYKSKKTGETYKWDEFGSEQEIELRELKNARNNAKHFFENNWFMFDEEWVPEYLGVAKYYKYAINVDEYDEIFEKTPAALKKAIANMSKGQKRSLMYRASELIKSGEIDSRKTISAIEEALGVDLIEK